MVPFPALQKLGMKVHIVNSCMKELEVEGSEVWGYPQLHIQLATDLGSMRSCLKKIELKKKNDSYINKEIQ